ncbi:hypothetical protein BST27_13945 [Mycobacterium intermedium]|uniref:Uncharacterized protein n=1 Tax=Mycobacterium intermedium TaxID=28445 RepID=A0A1E3S9Y0_MYCIE|nr:hypothetical protein [Mycobacterium intermedium]MCV6962432.1 hypothetical protein [Mycobacterium intermedium]ODQ98946.1 hypothetical protein BHQ20_19605 [Mycobacterium intermedium]OPE51245.1 hypothetical protein BV508_07250 [Mycobacterium intermedium]ORB04847.1 hypothetical protein BST27_13945 [Mycobacterium intermedium]
MTLDVTLETTIGRTGRERHASVAVAPERRPSVTLDVTLETTSRRTGHERHASVAVAPERRPSVTLDVTLDHQKPHEKAPGGSPGAFSSRIAK